jgi:arginine decarboxylase
MNPMRRNQLQNYAVDRWGEGYFSIDPEQGHLLIHPRGNDSASIDLPALSESIRQAGLDWPVLVRFMDIIHHRIGKLCDAFQDSIAESGYQGHYTVVYPIKVNQQRSVVDEIAGSERGRVGLEAGSKSELMAVLGLAGDDGVVVCNGYKDREYIRIALIGSRLVSRLYIVLEKPSEIDLVLKEAADLGIEPLLGVRMRLAYVPSGKWQDSGGVKSKFGLSAGQLLELVGKLRTADKLHCLQLLHSHIGSQIPNIRDIRHAMAEVARFYSEMLALGLQIKVVDVGGGLGVDYEGTGTRHFCSVNYSPDLYAQEVVDGLQRLCDQEGLPHPDIFSESGRALTAHHAVLITNVVESEAVPDLNPNGLPDLEEPHPTLARLQANLARIGDATPTELYQEAKQDLEEALILFEQGVLGLHQRALAEGLFFGLCRRLLPALRPSSSRHRKLFDELNEQLADKIFCNFSIFQSMPDSWAIDHVFPVMPLQRLNEAPTRHATIHDLTCDSDGHIGHYVDQDGIETSLPLHDLKKGERYLLGIFLVGAYQEILGDIHNLFGDANAINVVIDAQGNPRLSEPEYGDRVDQLLEYIHFEPTEILETYRQKLQRTVSDEAERIAWLEELRNGLGGYTYLED